MKPMVQNLYMIEYDVPSLWQKTAPISTQEAFNELGVRKSQFHGF